MKCLSCESEINRGSRYCPRCGAEVKGPEPELGDAKLAAIEARIAAVEAQQARARDDWDDWYGEKETGAGQ